MIEVKNTPGPWTAAKDGEGSRGDIYHVSADLGTVDGAAVCEFCYEADARLIAAAPDLLAACEALLRFAESVRPGGGVLAGEHDMLRDARAAISKAGGAA